MFPWRLDGMRVEKSSSQAVSPNPPCSIDGYELSPWDSLVGYRTPAVDRFSTTFTGGHMRNYNLTDTNHSSMKVSRTSKNFAREYQMWNCIGEGGFGYVFEGQRKSDKISVVVKVLPKQRIVNWRIVQDSFTPLEIEILWRLHGHPGIIRILEHFEEPDRFLLVMEKVPNSCTLYTFVMENSQLLAHTELLRHIFREMIRINILLQNYGVWHRDCKPENIIYCKTDHSLRFIDFGSAASVQAGDFYEFQGTLEIMAPEWILEGCYDGEESCVWSLGICLYFLLFQRYPFRSKNDIINCRSHLSSLYSSDKQAFRLVRQCLNRNRYRRPKLRHLLNSPWLEPICTESL